MGGPGHLVKRFLGAIRPGPPRPADERWAIDHLSSGEAEIWHRMNNPDRRHGVAVARAVVATYPRNSSGRPLDRSVVAAALLHDSGKVVSGLRTPARVVATLFWAVADDELADRWLHRAPHGMQARLAQYRRHPRLGSEMLRAAGSASLTYQWAADHHLPEEAWSVAPEVGRVLKDCDDD